jgi:hypothetical protein
MRPCLPDHRWLATALCCGSLLLACGDAFAVCGPSTGTTPADPTNRDNQMITDCMEQQDPAMKKEDAVEACKKKLKQGIALDGKAKKKKKPAASSDTTPQPARQ